jgi:hypothetical protein
MRLSFYLIKNDSNGNRRYADFTHYSLLTTHDSLLTTIYPHLILFFCPLRYPANQFPVYELNLRPF